MIGSTPIGIRGHRSTSIGATPSTVAAVGDGLLARKMRKTCESINVSLFLLLAIRPTAMRTDKVKHICCIDATEVESS